MRCGVEGARLDTMQPLTSCSSLDLSAQWHEACAVCGEEVQVCILFTDFNLQEAAQTLNDTEPLCILDGTPLPPAAKADKKAPTDEHEPSSDLEGEDMEP